MTEKAAVILDIRIGDTDHFVMRCAYVVKKRARLENLMSSRMEGWQELGGNEKV